MPVYFSLLRGINVGGNKVVLMNDLKKMFEKLGFSKVKTFIQSGNVVFLTRKKSSSELEEIIKAAIKERFKFEVGVLVLALDELEEIVDKNPFDKTKLKTGELIYLTVLSKEPAKEKVGELIKIKNSIDSFEVIDRTVYLLCRKGYTKSAFNNNSIEKILKVSATTRNIDTMTKLLELGRAI